AIHLTAILFFFYYHTSTTEIYTLSLHDALPISQRSELSSKPASRLSCHPPTSKSTSLVNRNELPHHDLRARARAVVDQLDVFHRSEEHTSELQSLAYLVCRLLLEKKKTKKSSNP